jgi:hypothetical protein
LESYREHFNIQAPFEENADCLFLIVPRLLFGGSLCFLSVLFISTLLLIHRFNVSWTTTSTSTISALSTALRAWLSLSDFFGVNETSILGKKWAYFLEDLEDFFSRFLSS